MDNKKSYGLLFKKNEKSEATKVGMVSNVFGVDSDSDEDLKKSKKLTAAEIFDKKYSSDKAKRLIEKSMAEDPSIFEYDEVYDKLKRTRGNTEEQKQADKEKKPKYVESIIKAHKRRELQKLIHDEHVYKKERENENGMFDDKEAFVTESYRKKVVERNAFRDEVDRQDALDDMTSVKDQQLWKQAFNRKLLDDISGEPVEIKTEPVAGTDIVNQSTSSVELKIEMTEVVEVKPTKQTLSSIKSEATSNAEDKRTRTNDDKCTTTREKRHSHSRHSPRHSNSSRRRHDSSRRKRSVSRDRNDHHRHSRKRSDYSENSSDKKLKLPVSSSRHTDKKSISVCQKLPKKNDLDQRMKKIRAILARRNNDKDIEEARQRYFKRQDEGSVVPPV